MKMFYRSDKDNTVLQAQQKNVDPNATQIESLLWTLLLQLIQENKFQRQYSFPH